MLKGFCPLIKFPSRHPPVLNGKNQEGRNINQNQMKNTHRSYIVFEVLKVYLTIIFEMQPLHLLFLVVISYSFIYFFLSFFTNFNSLIQFRASSIFVTSFPFLTNSLKSPPSPDPLKGRRCRRKSY